MIMERCHALVLLRQEEAADVWIRIEVAQPVTRHWTCQLHKAELEMCLVGCSDDYRSLR
jgi:hypothetical protein